MGDRSHIVIKEGKQKVFLYGHWMGESHIDILQQALLRGRDRWNDAPYLTRIVFCEMVRGSEMGTTDFGIWTTSTDDNMYPLIGVDCKRQEVRLESEIGALLHKDTIANFVADTSKFKEAMDRYFSNNK